LSHLNRKQVLVPPNFLNGYLCLSKECVFHYKLSYKGNYIDAKNQISINWRDNRLNIKWPIKKPILSKRDR
jgi:dTDP-4-dehydrorhamnose 3,5-epimerase